MHGLRTSVLLAALAIAACDCGEDPRAGWTPPRGDAGARDAGARDADTSTIFDAFVDDAAAPDAEPMDAEPLDAEPLDAEPMDAEPTDAEPTDAADAGFAPDALTLDATPFPDASAPDAAPLPDASVPDAGPPDAGGPIHVHIHVSNTCNLWVDPPEITVPLTDRPQFAWHNHSVDYPVDVWMSYGGGYLDLATGATWNEPVQHCIGPNPHDEWADISAGGCAQFRFFIRCR